MATVVGIWGMLLLYAVARLSQLYADRLPTLLIVVLHVIPPAVFALVHGAAAYGRRGSAVFAALCVGIGALAETLSLRTGFPFGRYHFTGVMGPKVLDLPVLLALAYLGMGYISWTLASLIARNRLFATPLLGSAIMTAWDLSMDPHWATLYQAWIWHDGGPYFGVPLSNFVGWYATAYIYFQGFALYCRARPKPPLPRRLEIAPILMYVICAWGNLLTLRMSVLPAAATDAAGVRWVTADILANCVLVSLCLMTPLAGLAWWRTARP
jgi:putative membrane protein